MPRESKKKKSCAYCGALFTPRTKNSLFCSADCREAEQERLKKERARKRQNTSFLPVFEYIDRVYKEEKILLSYGKAVARMQAERDTEERRRKEEKNERVYAKQKE